MDDYQEVKIAFVASIERARGLVGLKQYLENNYSSAVETDDLLRASVVQAVSAFDFLMHQTFRVEVKRRFSSQCPVNNFHIPFSILHSDETHKLREIEEFVVDRNSHRTFVDPAKVGEALAHFLENPWDKISSQTDLDATTLKKQLKRIYRWRNRIAHEADINPANAGVELWPIFSEDVILALQVIRDLGLAIISALKNSEH